MMKKPLLISVLFCLAIIPSFALAQSIDFEIVPQSGIVESGDITSFEITVHNNENSQVDIHFNVIGPHITWITQPGSITVDAHAIMTSEATIRPMGESPGIYEYNVSVSVNGRPAQPLDQGFVLEVVNPVDIDSMFISHDTEQLNVYLGLTSINSHESIILLEIINSAGETVKTESVPVVVNGDTTLVKTLPLSGVLAGNYYVVASIQGTGINASREMALEPVHNVHKSTGVEETAFGKSIIVTVTNNGNVVEHDYKIYEETTSFTGLAIRPSECYDTGGEKTACTSSIETLEPGETVVISYDIEYWPNYAGWTVGGLVAAMVFIFGFRKITAPRLKKKHVSTKNNTHTVALEIKNPFSRKKLTNVIIRDWVSPLARVVHEDFGTLKPVVRRTEAGTELIWKLGDIIGKEERVISYKLKSLVEGELKMPSAYLRYRDHKGRSSKVYSKGMLIS